MSRKSGGEESHKLKEELSKFKFNSKKVYDYLYTALKSTSVLWYEIGEIRSFLFAQYAHWY